MKNHAELLSAILAVRFDFLRINDVTLSDDIYNIDFYTAKNSLGVEYDGICLKNPRQDEFSVSEHQLAALRIASGPITAAWLEDFTGDANGIRLKDYLVEVLKANPNLDLKEMKFRVVAQLKVRNAVAGGDTPVYLDKCYMGALAFRKGVTALTKGQAGNRLFFSSPTYRTGMAELREALHGTPMNPKQPQVEVKLPIFQVIV